jgi:NAD(P)-dependent dehydrogenase (short-subunit alcohol dehydrogenase family)
MGAMEKTVVITGNDKEFVHALIRGFLLKNYNVLTTVEFHGSGNLRQAGPARHDHPQHDHRAGSTPENQENQPEKSDLQARQAESAQPDRQTQQEPEGHPEGSKQKDQPQGPPEQESVHTYTLNNRSPLSVRSLMLEGINTFGSIDEAVVTYTFGEENRVLHDLPVTEIEKQVDATIKGAIFLLKELIAHFWKQQKGTLSIVLRNKRSGILLPLDALEYGALRELTESVFTQYKNEPITLNGFESGSGNIDDFVAFIFKTLQEKGSKTNGKWFHHSGKSGLLNSLSLPGLSKS